MSLFRPPLRIWTLLALGALLLAWFAWHLAWGYASTPPTSERPSLNQMQSEIIKLGLQFVMVTLVGGILVGFINARKDQDQREHAGDAAVREMVAHVLAVDRKLKIVKRRLRSRIDGGCTDRTGARNLPFRIAAADFEKGMEDLLAAQIDAEQVRDSVRARDDLLSVARIERVHRALAYAAGYYHDVYLEYENCRITRGADQKYEVTTDCPNLADFLGRSAWKHEPNRDLVARLEDAHKKLKDESIGTSITDRYEGLDVFVRAHADEESRRFRIVATLAIVLASADLQRAVRRQRWRRFARAAMAQAQADLAAEEKAETERGGETG